MSRMSITGFRIIRFEMETLSATLSSFGAYAQFVYIELDAIVFFVLIEFLILYLHFNFDP